MKKQKLLIIDAHSVIHRAYHALPRLTTKEGRVVNALYGFLLVFLKAIKDFHPNYIVAAFDLPLPTFRHKKYPEYKAKRPKTADDLVRQIPKVKEVLNAFAVPVFELAGFEADDIIGTISSLVFDEPSLETIILSGDADVLQLVDQKTKVYLLRRGVKDIVLYDQSLVKKKYHGLEAKQLLDYKALRGDPSDNIPGVIGIGEKTAIKLLLEFNNLENIYKAISLDLAEKLPKKTFEILKKSKAEAFLSRELSEINKGVPLNFNLEECLFNNYDLGEITQVLKNFEFYSLISKLPEIDYNQKEELGENLKLW